MEAIASITLPSYFLLTRPKGLMMIKKSITPRISEINGARHAAYDAICAWLEVGFVDFLMMFGESPVTEPPVAMVNLTTDFWGEIFFGKTVEITTCVTKLGNSSFVLHHEMYQGEKRCVSAVTTFVCFDYKKKKSLTIPPDVSQEIRKHLIEGE